MHSTALSFHAVPSHKTNMKVRLPGRMCPEIQSTISCRVGRNSLLSRRHIIVAILIFKTYGLHLDVSGRNYLVIFAGGSFRQGVRVPIGGLVGGVWGHVQAVKMRERRKWVDWGGGQERDHQVNAKQHIEADLVTTQCKDSCECWEMDAIVEGNVS